MRFAAGARFGIYEVVGPMGAGGMGEVYRARDLRLKRDVAIKVLHGAWTGDGDRLARFAREAELLAALNHPNVAVIHGVDDVEGTPALILELVEGPTLAERLVGGPIPLAEAMPIARQIVDALDAAHEKGIVHRDLKPANIKIREDGTVKVLDFGLAKALEPDAVTRPDVTTSPTLTSPAMTRLGMVLGTAAYMSPEQARGHAIDKRTDIWAFGCVFYEMLTGRTAFARETVSDTIAAILEREPDWSALPPSTPIALRRLLRRCLEKNRHQRLRDVGDVRFALDDIAESAAGTDGGPRRAMSALLIGGVLLAGVAAIAATRALWNRDSGAPGGAVVGAQFTRLTPDDAFATEPALSRDGTLVVYASDRAGDGQLDLWVQRTSSGQPIRLTDDPADDREPDFSADGSLIVFRSNRGGGGVYVMPALGGNARLVAEGGQRPRFSPNGSRIAYWAGPWLSNSGTRAAGSSLWTVPAHGGSPTRVADAFVTARDPIWSPDGNSLLFFGRKTNDDTDAGLFDWWWAPLDGREPVATGALRATERAGFSALDLPQRHEDRPGVWTDSGVVFSALFGGSVNLWRLQVSQQTGQVDPASLERLTAGTGSDESPSADGAGRLIFRNSTEGFVSLTLPLDANDGRASGPVTRRSFWAGQAGGRNSLDDAGRLLVYPKRRLNEIEIWVKDLATGHERHLVTTAASVQLNPVISHTGDKVAYTLSEGGRNIGYVMPTAGGTPTEVCQGCTLQGWFGDDRRILALDDPGPPGRVLVVDVVDRTAAELAVHPSSGFGRADVSPDGRWLSFQNQRDVWVAPLGEGLPVPSGKWVSVRTVADNSAERACGWSPDGRLLYLLLERDGFRDLYAQKIDAARGTPVGEPFLVQHLHDPRRRWGSTPFGTAIVSNAFVFNMVEQTGSIWLREPE